MNVDNQRCFSVNLTLMCFLGIILTKIPEQGEYLDMQILHITARLLVTHVSSVPLEVNAVLSDWCRIWEHLHLVSGKWNVSRIIPKLHGWIYKALRLSLLAVQHIVEVMTPGSQSRRTQIESMGSQFSISVLLNLCSESVEAKSFEILVEDSFTCSPSSGTVRIESLFAFQFWYCGLCEENRQGEAESIVLIVLVLWQCF